MRFFHHNLDFSQAFEINSNTLTFNKKEEKVSREENLILARCMVKLEFEKKTQRILFSFSRKAFLVLTC